MFDDATRAALDNFDLAAYVQRDGITLQRVGKVWQGLCPFHSEATPSFTVYQPGRGWYCFGCGQGGSALDYVIDRAGGERTNKADITAGLATLGIGHGRRFDPPPLAPRPASPRRKPPPAPLGEPASIYEYHNSTGALVYQVCRYVAADGKKTFRQRRPDGRGGWTWDLAGIAPLLYRLPALLAADPALPVFVCEGEKCADRLAAAGLVSTCNSGGAGKWPAACSHYLAGRRVIILPDNDEPGRRHAALVADELRPVAAAVTVLALPGLADHGDVFDFLAVHTADALQVLAAYAPALPPPAVAGDVDPATGELVITGADDETSIATADLIAALQARAERAEQERDAAQAELDHVWAMLRNKGQSIGDRVVTLGIQRVARRRGLEPGVLGELPHWEVSQEVGVSTDTVSRVITKLHQTGAIVDVETHKLSGPEGVKSRSLAAIAPALYEVTALVSPASAAGNKHGGYREPCPNCGADGKYQVDKRQCTKCHHTYIPIDNPNAGRPPMPQDAAHSAPGPAVGDQGEPPASTPAPMPQLAAHDIEIGGNLRHRESLAPPASDTPASLIGTASAVAWSRVRAVADNAAPAPVCEVCGPLVVCTCPGRAPAPIVRSRPAERSAAHVA